MFRIGLFLLCFAGLAFGQTPSRFDADLTKKMDAIIKDWQKLKPGMTRADIEKMLHGEGGIIVPSERNYVWPSCPYVKVRIEFNMAPNQVKELPSDTVKSVSKPFIEYAIDD